MFHVSLLTVTTAAEEISQKKDNIYMLKPHLSRRRTLSMQAPNKTTLEMSGTCCSGKETQLNQSMNPSHVKMGCLFLAYTN